MGNWSFYGYLWRTIKKVSSSFREIGGENGLVCSPQKKGDRQKKGKVFRQKLSAPKGKEVKNGSPYLREMLSHSQERLLWLNLPQPRLPRQTDSYPSSLPGKGKANTPSTARKAKCRLLKGGESGNNLDSPHPPKYMPKKELKDKRNKYWNTMVDILDGQFPKGECKERGKALVMLAYIEMMLNGWKFDENGNPIKKI